MVQVTPRGPSGAPISDEAVRARTGKTWPEWFAILDAAGAAAMPHKQIARYLADEQQVPAWWAQMVTVSYERARGLRETHQTCAGDYQASGSKTVAVPVERLYAAWADDAQRSAWLAASGYTIRKATPNRSLRITWADGTTVEVSFWAKGPGKSQVSLSHTKLPDAEAVARCKALWQEQLERLRTLLEA